MIKKYGILGAVSLLVLAGCTNSNENTPDNSSEIPVSTGNSVNTQTGTDTTGDTIITGNSYNMTGESEVITGSEIVSGSETKVYTINKTYRNPAGEYTINGTLTVENGIVKSMELINPQGPSAIFAKDAPAKIIGKPLSGLQVDSVTGASLTTAAFNEFLNDLNK